MSVKGCIKHRRKDADGILDEKSIPVPETGCWLWTGQTNRSGYGVVWFDGRMWLAHRLSYITFVSGVPDGLHVCHKCDTPACINPDHLFAGSNKENMHDASNKGRLNRQSLTHCINGHPLTGENLIVRPGPVAFQRQCRKCQNDHNREFMRKARAKTNTHPGHPQCP